MSLGVIHIWEERRVKNASSAETMVLNFLGGSTQKTFRYLWRFYSLLFRGFFVAFPWLFRGPLLSRKTVFGPFLWLFRGFFVAFSWPLFWAKFTRTRPGTVF